MDKEIFTSKRMPWLLTVLMFVGLFAFSAPFLFTNSGVGGHSENLVEMSGEVGDYNPELGIDDPTHDPAIFKDGDTYFVASTGIARDAANPGGIYLRKSEGNIGGPWEAIGEIDPPEWTQEYRVAHLWAPDVIKREDNFYLYYAASSFGTNNSAIGAAVSETPEDPESWEDLGPILTSDSSVPFNAIDPEIFKDGETWWMVFGSHFSGIHLQQLEDMTELTGSVHNLASRASTTQHNAIEAPTIIERDGYYYLFTSWDRCCAGTDSTYKIAVGRSESVTGPYVDKDGTPLTEGGGEVILESTGNQIGPGGQDILQENDGYYLVHHYYDQDADGVIRMQIRELFWENEWPLLP